MAEAPAVRSLERGAMPLPDGGTRFSVWAPNARLVEVVLNRDGQSESHPLAGDEGGVHSGIIRRVPPGTDYGYRLDGRVERPDPVSRWRPRGVHGPTRVVDPAAFQWTDKAWRGLETADLVIYELHVGTFTPEGTFDGVIARLPSLRELGVTALEIMPVAEFPGSRNWGYDGVSPYAVQSTYGGPNGLKRLVDAAHRAGLAVLLDVVYNHLGPEGNYLAEMGPYFSDRHQTAWGHGFNLDGPDSDEVRRYVVDNAVYWITEYHLDGLRLDAADRIVDLGPVHIAEEIGEAVHAQGDALGRRALVIAEIDANDPRWVRGREVGGYGLDAHWSDDFHHAVHVALTGERTGYYRDFTDPRAVAKVLDERYVNDGRYSLHRKRKHGRPATDVPADRFVVAVQNHDQTGNRARGERLAALVPPEALRLAAALLLLSPYVPLLFMGEEHGETNPFLYFVSHGDPALVEAVREGRRREFEAFAWSGEVPDPQAESTFEASRPQWKRAETGGGARLRALYRDLLRLRRSEHALRPGAAAITVREDEVSQWVAVRYETEGEVLEGIFNLSTAAVAVPPDSSRRWSLVLSTDAPGYGGTGEARLERDVRLPPRAAVLLRAVSS
ncbi:MAG TPA: malto-oligosyltrehalose trehalohydrolase [Gemmatimonadales bacterium]|nr:malto-oligosyltrehalose trehalohydrolase [Gemmatimonadales bacterium]